MRATYSGLFSLEATLVRKLAPTSTTMFLHRGANAFQTGGLLLAAMRAIMPDLVDALALHRCP